MKKSALTREMEAIRSQERATLEEVSTMLSRAKVAEEKTKEAEAMLEDSRERLIDSFFVR